MDRDELIPLLEGVETAEDVCDRLEQAGLLPLEAEWRWSVGEVTGDTMTSTKQWRHVTDWR